MPGSCGDPGAFQDRLAYLDDLDAVSLDDLARHRRQDAEARRALARNERERTLLHDQQASTDDEDDDGVPA